jgi:hypothetical protein
MPSQIYTLEKEIKIKEAIFVVLIWKYESVVQYYCNLIFSGGNMFFPMLTVEPLHLHEVLYFSTE